jgi:CD109 antigen
MSKKHYILTILIVMALLIPLLPACTQTVQPVTAYTAIIPAILQAGSQESIPIALFAGDAPTSGKVNLYLLKDGQVISHTEGSIDGNGQIPITIPAVDEGDYTIQVSGPGFQNQANVTVENNFLVFLETDKPIYKPGQTLHMRTMTMDAELKPVVETVTVDVLDAKGNKIYREATVTDEYGMSSMDLPISNEPNLGTWKINASTPKAKTELDVRVEEYALPKFEVKTSIPRNWYLVSESIQGNVSAAYTFGKPVKGDLEIIATKYVGKWVEYADVKISIDGSVDFTISPAEYVAGVPAAQGKGNVKLEFIVTEAATGYQERTDSLLTVSESSTNLSIIPAGVTFKPGLPYSFLVVSETPDNQLIDSQIRAEIAYLDSSFGTIKNESFTQNTEKGKTLFEINPPLAAIALTIDCSTQNTSVTKTIEAAYSPTGNFIHLEQTSEGTPSVSDNINFWIYSTSKVSNFYYEVISRGTVIYSNYVKGNEITLTVTPAMAPAAKLLVYQIQTNAEVAADYLPFSINAQYPQSVSLDMGTQEAAPGDNIYINIHTESESEVGLAAVDKSVFILAENRMNLQQVFDQLEQLYMEPQAEVHEVNIWDGITTQGAQDVFKSAGVIVLTSGQVPQSIKYESPMQFGFREALNGADKGIVMPPIMAPIPTMAVPTTFAVAGSTSGLVEVQRVRRFFPETWLWNIVKTNTDGEATLKEAVPDTITTWMLRAVALSKDKGLGIAEAQLKVFQPFFLTIDLPYSAIRGEEFPVSVAIYNYLDQLQNVVVDIQGADWFDLLDQSEKSLTIQPNDIGSVEFMIRPTQLGNTNEVKVTARTPQSADAVIKTIIIEPEGVGAEQIKNYTLEDGKTENVSTAIPFLAVDGSGRVYLAVTSSFLTQTMDGLESLIQMPFGCGEQNMIIFAPDVFITRYLQSSGQLKPEIMAKAEKLMLTGYQRELTFRHTDGSFSAFGDSDKSGSLWLTAFVVKCFAQAKDLIYIDDSVMSAATAWILNHQNTDGSFDAVGLVIHQEMLGSLQGKSALTAYISAALMEAGEKNGSARAVAYLENQIDQTDDPYALALISYALEMAGSAKTGVAYDKLMKSAVEDENGLQWGSDQVMLIEQSSPQLGLKMMPRQPQPQTTAVEATAYATLALIKHGDKLNASRAAKWLVSKRNAFGGYSSTQDTVMALQALVTYSTDSRADVDLNVKVECGGKTQTIVVNASNFDILQTIELPVNDKASISVSGRGDAIGQIVARYNLPAVETTINNPLTVDVKYDADEVAVNDEVKVSVDVAFNPPEPIESGMLVIDIAVPTGFAAVKDSIDKILTTQDIIKRYDISGRKVIFYVDNLKSGGRLAFEFTVKALYPVKAKGVESHAYSYYSPEYNAQSLGPAITIK